MQGKPKVNGTRWQDRRNELSAGKRKHENRKPQQKEKFKNRNDHKVLDQQPKCESLEKEIDEMAKKIKLANKQTMLLLQTLTKTPNGKTIQKNSSVEEETEDLSSVKGQFGWAEVARTIIPYLTRSGERYVSLRMVENKVFFKYKNVFTDEVHSCFKVKILPVTSAEAKLLNEINFRHCDNFYGNLEFTTNEEIVSFKDFIEMYDFLNFCYSKLIEKANVLQTRCGFTKIADQNCVPYIWHDKKQYFPLFYFEGECKYLKEQSIEVTGWDLAYLKLYCKIQGIRKSLYDGESVRVVDLDLVKKFFPPDTVFEESWPSDYKIDFLLQKPVPRLVLFQTQNSDKQVIPEGVTQNPNGANKQPISQTGQFPVVINGNQAKNTALPNAKHVTTLTNMPSTGTGTQKKSRLVQLHPNTHPSNNFSVLSAPHASTNHQMQILKNNKVLPPNNPLPKIVPSAAPNPNDYQRSFMQYTHAGSSNTSPYPFTGYRQTPPARPRLQKMSRIIQIPEVTLNDAYFMVRAQVEDKILQYCINKEPYVASVLLVSLEECSVFFHLPIEMVINAVNVLNVDIYLPNRMQKKTFEKFKLYLSRGMLNLQDFVESLPQLKYILYKSKAPC